MKKQSFFQKAALLFSGSLLAQGIYFLATLLLARLYSPELFGWFAMFLAAANILALAFTGRQEIAAILPRSGQEAHQLAWLSIWLIHLSLVPGAVACLALGRLFPQMPVNPWLALAGAYLLALWSVIQHLLLRDSRYSLLSTYRVGVALSISAVQFVLFYRATQSGLQVGYLAGLALVLLFSLAAFRGHFRHKPRPGLFRKVFQKYRSVTTWSLVSGLLNTGSNQALPIIIGSLFGGAQAGFFFMAFRLLNTPIGLVTTSISQAFFREASIFVRNKNSAALQEQIKEINRWMGVLLALVCLLALTLAHPFIHFLLGEEWAESATLIIWLLPYFLGKGLASPVSSLAESLNRVKVEAYFNLSLLGILLFATGLGYYYQQFKLFILTFSVLSGAAYLIFWLSLLYIVRHEKYEAKH